MSSTWSPVSSEDFCGCFPRIASARALRSIRQYGLKSAIRHKANERPTLANLRRFRFKSFRLLLG